MRESDIIMKRKKTSPARIITFLILTLGAFTMILPFIWMLSTSLKGAESVYTIHPKWIPDPVDWNNYKEIWQASNLITGIKNSSIISFLVLLISTFTTSMSAFAFAKLRFPGKKIIFMMLLATMMVPGIVLVVPQFIIYSSINWIDTLLPMIVPVSLCNISNIFFQRQYMIGLPNTYIDAARIDGCSFFGAYWRIFLPLSKPAIIANSIMLFMGTWNDYFNPLIFTHSDSKQTVQVAIAMMNSHYQQQTDIPLVMVASLIALIPVLIIFITCQKYFVESFAMSGIKG